MTDQSESAFTQDDLERTTVTDTPQPKKRGRPPGSRSTTRVAPPPGTPPQPGQPQQTPAQQAAAKKARVKKRESEIRALIKDTVNPLLLQGAAMVVPPWVIFQVQPTPDQTALEVVLDKNNLPVPTEMGQRFYVSELEAQIASMTLARLEDLPMAGQLERLAEVALPYALIGGLVLAGGMYTRRVIATVSQLRAAAETRIVEVPVGEDHPPTE